MMLKWIVEYIEENKYNWDKNLRERDLELERLQAEEEASIVRRGIRSWTEKTAE